MKKRRLALRSKGTIGLLSALLLLSSCFDDTPSKPNVITHFDDDDDEDKVEKKEQDKVKKPTYAYNPIGKRDPFLTYLVAEEDSKFRPVDNPGRRKSALETYTLDQLRLTAIISGTSSPVAMVEDPNNKGWTIRVGTRIGTNGGKVSAIMRDGLVITEEYRDAVGRKRLNKVNMNLPVDVIILDQ